jgi:signal transduction histidine kinase
VVVHGTVSDETERNLRQSSQAQGERLATMGRLAASLAHELNNPLQVVLHNVDSLAQELARLAEHASRWRWEQAGGAGEPAPEEAAERPEPALLQDAYERAREALAATLRIKEVTERLGAFARVERREATRIDPVRALRSALKLAAHEIGCRARLVEELLPVPAVLASEGKLAHALLNLLLNAAQAIDEGEVEHNRITVRSWADGSNIFLEIADTGQGIAPENLGRIFEPFFTTKGAGRGSGLGLSLARSLVSSFGGELEVESELGKGSKFRLRLPAAGGCETEVERPSGAQALGGLHRSDGSQPAGAEAPFAVRGRILVVDDEEMIRRTMVRVLDPDHEVVTGASGREGQAILERDTAFDVILCDLMMPDMSGMDLHRWMAERNPDVARRFVFVSGGAFTERAEQYLAMAGNPQVSKPIGTTALRRYVADLVLEARNGPRT